MAIEQRTTKPVSRSSYFDGSPADGLAKMKAELEVQRQRATVETESWYVKTAETNIQKLTEWIATAEKEAAGFAERVRRTEEANAANPKATEEAAEDALRGELHTYFMAGNPGASERDFEQAYPGLKERHQVERMDRAMEQARNNPAYHI